VRIEVGETKAVLVRDGFHDQWIDVGKGTSGWIIGNLVSWGILGLFVDAVGGANVVSDGPCLVELTPATDAAPAVWKRPKPSASQPSGPEPLRDGDFVRHDGQVYRLAGDAPIHVTSWKNLGGRQQAHVLERESRRRAEPPPGRPVPQF
jgi:hypothetical protein